MPHLGKNSGVIIDKTIDQLARDIIHASKHVWLTLQNYADVCNRVSEYEKIASQVIEGVWGNGWNLENAITGAGYDFETVMMLVEVNYEYRNVL